MDFDGFSFKKGIEGVVERAVDLVLLMTYFNLETPFLLRHKRHLIEDTISEDLAKFNYQKLKRACAYLKQKGLIQTLKEVDSLPRITQAGERRLRSIIPFYDSKRVWDGRLFLVSYDIPRKKNSQRNLLRDYLKKIGCGCLQQSVWLTPYNPADLIKNFTKEHNLSEELILISSIGKDGTIGRMTMAELVERVYHLEALNQKYQQYILFFKRGKMTKSQLIFGFLSILQDDPQLPFALLPDNWLGDKAFKLFQSLKR